MYVFVTLPFDKYGETEQKSILEAPLAIIFLIYKEGACRCMKIFIESS